MTRSRFGLDPIRDIQVLCPMNRGGVGARSLNIELQAALNPAGERKVERFGWTFAPGDKVMQIENDYDKEVYNGDIGYVDDVAPASGELVVGFDGRSVTYGFGELDPLVPAYATTIRKSQGSEYPAVVIPRSDAALPHATAEPAPMSMSFPPIRQGERPDSFAIMGWMSGSIATGIGLSAIPRRLMSRASSGQSNFLRPSSKTSKQHSTASSRSSASAMILTWWRAANRMLSARSEHGPQQSARNPIISTSRTPTPTRGQSSPRCPDCCPFPVRRSQPSVTCRTMS